MARDGPGELGATAMSSWSESLKTARDAPGEQDAAANGIPLRHRNYRLLPAFFPDGYGGCGSLGTCVSGVSNLAGSRLWGEAPSVGPPDAKEQASAHRRLTRVVSSGR